VRAQFYPDLAALPPAARALLDDPAVFEAGAAWWQVCADTGLTEGAQAVFLCIDRDGRPLAVVPLQRLPDGRLASLSTLYTCLWQPVLADGLDRATLVALGRMLGATLRQAGPARMEAMDPTLSFLPALATGLRRALLVPLRFGHFGNWHEAVAGLDWDAYMARRPGALRETVRRRLRRLERDDTLSVACVRGGAELAEAIDAYEQVYAISWKDPEPSPGFGPALLRAAAGQGALRLWVLRQHGKPVAAQYWVVWAGKATVHKLAHDEAARALSPGTLLTALAIRDLLQTDRVAELDFGRGDDPYKQSWTAHRRERIGWLVCNPATAAGLREIARHFAGSASRRARGRTARPNIE
jgi:Acetyltransferase (GNAT) domain